MKKLLISLCLLASFGAFAQTPSANLDRNSKAACDSTCITPGVPLGPKTTGYEQQTIACSSDGTYSGTKIQTRSINSDGTKSAWATTANNDPSNKCLCTNKTGMASENGVCPAGQKGYTIKKQDWVCSDTKNGSTKTPYVTDSSNCYTPCKVPAAQTQNVSCSAGYSGSITQTRTATCPADDRLAPVWGSWSNTSSNCTYIPPYVPPYVPPPPENFCFGSYGYNANFGFCLGTGVCHNHEQTDCTCSYRYGC